MDNDGSINIYRVKPFTDPLMQSKFCDEADHLVATGGFMSGIEVWDCSTSPPTDVARFDHNLIDPNFQGLDIEWQNATTVAVAGKSKYIYLWSIDKPSEPLVKWEGH